MPTTSSTKRRRHSTSSTSASRRCGKASRGTLLSTTRASTLRTWPATDAALRLQSTLLAERRRRWKGVEGGEDGIWTKTEKEEEEDINDDMTTTKSGFRATKVEFLVHYTPTNELWRRGGAGSGLGTVVISNNLRGRLYSVLRCSCRCLCDS